MANEGDTPTWDPKFYESNEHLEFKCSICHHTMTLAATVAHRCIIQKTGGDHFLVLVTKNRENYVLPMPDSVNAIWNKGDQTNQVIMTAPVKTLQGMKKLILLKSSPTSSSAESQDCASFSSATKKFNCGICLVSMTLEAASKHDCVLRHTNDLEGRFLVLNNCEEFYPITDKGTHFLYRRLTEDQQLEVFKSPIQEFIDQSPTFELVNKVLLEHYKNLQGQPQQRSQLLIDNKTQVSVTEQHQATIKHNGRKPKNKSAGAVSRTFSEKEDVALIEAVEKREPIWNFKIPSDQRYDKKRLYEEIASQVPELKNKTAHELQARWENIVTARSRNIQNNKKKLVSGTKATTETPYKYEDCMKFLNNIEMNSQQTASNIGDIQVADSKNSTEKENLTPNGNDERSSEDADESSNTSNGFNNKYKRKGAPSTTEALNNIAKAMSAPINITLPPMPQLPTTTAAPPPISEINDEDVWWLNVRRHLRRLSPRKKQKKMDDIEFDLQAYLREVQEGNN